jgi:hypothetical protein
MRRGERRGETDIYSFYLVVEGAAAAAAEAVGVGVPLNLMTGPDSAGGEEEGGRS